MRCPRIAAALFSVALLALTAAPLQAQVLVWSLPKEEGTWVRFEGTYKNRQVQPESTSGDLELEWRSELTIKALASETADWNGKPTKCRWLEFKTLTGKESEQGLLAGPFGTRIYKVLVPEERILGRLVDSDNIPLTYLPIVKGVRKIGDRDPAPITSPALAIYPMVSLLAYYPNLSAEGATAEDLDLPIGAISALPHSGSVTVETKSSLSTNTGKIWRSEQVPFGVAKFQVRIENQRKDVTAPREDFKPSAVVDMELSAVATGTDAQTELPE